jgi:spermidine synthase
VLSRKSNFEVLAYDRTELGELCLRRRELLSQPGTVVTEVTLDHELLMSSFVTDSERALAREGLEHHPGSDLRVLIGGLGLGYTAREVLVAGGARVARVEVVELLPTVIGWVERGLVPLSEELAADPRLEVLQGDVYEWLARAPDASDERWDLVLIDVDHSPDERLGEQSAGFYTEAGLRRARAHLADGGVLGVWSYAEDSAFATAMRTVFRDVAVEEVTVVNELVGEEQTDWLFFGWG